MRENAVFLIPVEKYPIIAARLEFFVNPSRFVFHGGGQLVLPAVVFQRAYGLGNSLKPTRHFFKLPLNAKATENRHGRTCSNDPRSLQPSPGGSG